MVARPLPRRYAVSPVGDMSLTTAYRHGDGHDLNATHRSFIGADG